MSEDEFVYNLSDIQYDYSVKSLEGTTKTFQLKIDNMKIQRGVLTAILGHSGSGKTTLLSLLGLLRKPLFGSFNLQVGSNSYSNNQIWKDPELAERIRAVYLGFALQNGELLPYLTIRENIEFPLRLTNKIKNIENEVNGWLDKLYSKDESELIRDKRAQAVSKGQYQRCAIARSLVHEPEVVLADEPTGNLDEGRAIDLLRLLKDSLNSRRSIILVTHDINLALGYANEIWVMKKGEIINHYKREGKASRWSDRYEKHYEVDNNSSEMSRSGGIRGQIEKDLRVE